ncbi:dihydrolipoamide acetyltransferase component of pyruvate dehydrogenase complex [Micromonospora sonchi]|uniref:Dihydrolipoamide acetyltransferase component of pyruvate dehydrogenase complex n=1 Tax=Micromonospora sonchi TaxID=1763543 RepID=A0A917TVC9_9ACTN|nr:dihydrolipoamide acetyltransferase family protein [Micromonospora sonchi]GGM39652.1 dihydrolipoamide acetyltransferase component of pyruvate dehydrogenase complex [Micromonospora sonchi]
MSAQVFLLPDLGEGLTEAEIVRWRVAVGDTVTVDQSVVEVETAKAVVDVPCPYAGRVVALHGAEGEVRPVGQPLITVAAPAVVGAAPVAGGAAMESAEPVGHAVYREEERAGSGNVLIGYGTGHGTSRRRRRPRVVPAANGAEPAGSSASAQPRPGPAPVSPIVPPAAPLPGSSAVSDRSPALVISPIVRRLARERGVDLTTLRGSAPGGVIRRADVEAAAGAAIVAGASGAGAVAPSGAGTDREPVGGVGRLTAVPDLPAQAPTAHVGLAPAGASDVVIPLTGIRRAIADKLSRSRREIPEVTIWVDADATALLETRAAINAARPDSPVSILALLARICLSGLRRYPQLNSRVDTEGQRIIQSAGVHLGIAAQTERGLVVPVLRDADRLTTAELAAELAATTAAARAGELPPARLTGGSFTLNNYGVFGVDGSTPIINHPEAALLGVGRIVDKPWVVDGQLAVRKVTQLSLTFDHRVCDGAVAGGFLRHVADCVEQPALLVAAV